MNQVETPVKLSVYQHDSVFEELEPEWNELVRRSIADCVFSTVEWQRNWWAAYQPGELWVVTARDEDERLIGIGSWFIETRQEGERVLRSIGCVEVTDYVDCIIDRDCTEQVFGCFAEYLSNHADRYDRINLCNLPHYSPTFEQFPPVLERFDYQVEVVQQEVCPVIELPDDWEGYLNLLDKKQRHELRRKIRRGGAEGEMNWYVVNESHNLEEQLALFLKLMAESSKDKAEFLRDPQNVAFFNRVMPVLFANGWLQLVFLTINGEPAATYLNFDYNRRLLVYNSGLSPAHFNASPGILLLAHIIRHAIENGYEVFDFLRGNEEYKYRMGAKDTAVYMLKASKR
jgi:CelD/BcsL family acetyltransferase involved in cellulose biosynthesis